MKFASISHIYVLAICFVVRLHFIIFLSSILYYLIKKLMMLFFNNP